MIKQIMMKNKIYFGYIIYNPSLFHSNDWIPILCGQINKELIFIFTQSKYKLLKILKKPV